MSNSRDLLRQRVQVMQHELHSDDITELQRALLAVYGDEWTRKELAEMLEEQKFYVYRHDGVREVHDPTQYTG